MRSRAKQETSHVHKRKCRTNSKKKLRPAAGPIDTANKIMIFISLAWPYRFFPFLFVVAGKRVWSGSHTHLVFAPPTVVGGDNLRNVIKIWI